MGVQTELTDEQLLTATDPEAFGTFYARHLAAVQRYFKRRVGDSEAATDLAAETFASALVARRRFVPGDVPATAWLYAIAARRLVDFHRRRAVEVRTRETFASELAVELPWEPAWSPEVRDDLQAGMLRHLPAEQREAVAARVLHDREYREIAAEFGASEASIRQRVSRGLNTLRGPLQVYRAAHEIARQDRAYRLTGGHRTFLSAIGPREPLDCSSCASLILARAGLFESDRAWTSARLAEHWGRPGEGLYMTLWANDDHVWLEFKLDADQGERFDPTPSRLHPDRRWLSRSTGPTRELTPRHWPRL